MKRKEIIAIVLGIVSCAVCTVSTVYSVASNMYTVPMEPVKPDIYDSCSREHVEMYETEYPILDKDGNIIGKYIAKEKKYADSWDTIHGVNGEIIGMTFTSAESKSKPKDFARFDRSAEGDILGIKCFTYKDGSYIYSYVPVE